MAYRNLKACWDALEKLDNDINNLCPKNIIFIDQNLHISVQDEKSKKKTFFRDMAIRTMSKIILDISMRIIY